MRYLVGIVISVWLVWTFLTWVAEQRDIEVSGMQQGMEQRIQRSMEGK